MGFEDEEEDARWVRAHRAYGKRMREAARARALQQNKKFAHRIITRVLQGATEEEIVKIVEELRRLQ